MEPRNAERLTKRQHDVMLLLTTGAQDKEIAATLGCGLKRVKQHTSDCYGRLGVRNRVQAAVRGRPPGPCPSRPREGPGQVQKPSRGAGRRR